jgi:hydrogenase maturation protein HypF
VSSRAAPVQRSRARVEGVVQGVGFRPFVHRLAGELALDGFVFNDERGVVVEVQGAPDRVDAFLARLRDDAPPLAVVERVLAEAVEPLPGAGFRIVESARSGRPSALVSADVATCEDCLRELFDPADRRYRYPFLNCTNCGPRFTIVTGIPYDRPNTTMAGFAMCDACRAEYDDPGDRRFHAQPIACHDCGPRLALVAGEERRSDEDALREARRLLSAGRILAVKGIGGYHLACDARNEEAVAELRRRKQRGGKPFAVMVADLAMARDLVAMTGDEEHLLTGGRAPIVLLPRSGRDDLAASVAPGNPDLGILLPYAPLHVLLFGLDADPAGPDALVMTSGNLAGEPIVTDDEEALTRLAPFADAWLTHDRPIQVPCDDSVSRFVAGAELPIRRARGHAPLPIALPVDVEPTLAVGADLKNTCALAEGRYAFVSQHIGDMDDLSTAEALTRTARQLAALTGVRATRLVADRHPGYHSAAWADEHAGTRPVHHVQHHHAHVAAVMGEHGLGGGEQVIGFAFDGTGYGTDGAVWGGEVLIADYKSFRRAAHLGYVPLPGGDASVLRPYRMALSHLHAAGVPWDDDLPSVLACPAVERAVLDRQLATGFGCVPTSSMGRLFDAVASLAGVRHEVDYEAEAAMALEGLARTAGTRTGYAFGVRPPGANGSLVADPAPVIRAIVTDLRGEVPAAEIAARFHTAVTALITDLAVRCREQTGLAVVALGGGVFQNALLLGGAQLALTERGFTVLRPRLLPPNDGGLALGQILIAAAG